LPDHARYDYLLNQPEKENVAKKIKLAMEAIEEYKEELEGVLPKEEYAPPPSSDLILNFAAHGRRWVA
jgi:type I restriction enzyme M protein